jgi:hypothetical protein
MSMEIFHRYLWEGMWENKNVFGNIYAETFPTHFYFPTFLPGKIKMSVETSPLTFVGRNVGKIKMSMDMSMEIFHRFLFVGQKCPENKNVYGNCLIEICGKDIWDFPTFFLKMKMFMGVIHRHLWWEGMWENKNVYEDVYRNFLWTFLFSHIPS